MSLSPKFLPVPDDAELLRDALEGLTVGEQSCICPNRYHALWGVFKAAGVHRGIYAESTGLADVIRPLLVRGAHVLIAGTADTTALQLLGACAGSPSDLRFTVADRCPSPLRRVAAHAAAHRMDVRTVETDLSMLGSGDPWDLVFIHYTLSFADTQARRSILRAIADGLAPGGTVICVAKFGERAGGNDPGDAWLAPLRPAIDRVLAGHPEARASVDALLPGYAKSRDERATSQPTVEELEADLASAGLAVRARHATARSEWTRSAEFPTVDRQETMILVAVHAAER